MTQVAYNRPMRLDTDTNVTAEQADTMLDALNVRLFQNGGDLVLSTIPGMVKAFTITSGYSIVGYCQYNGVLYIASINVNTDKFEVGTFPHRLNGVLVDSYKPLHNYVGSLDYNAFISNGQIVPPTFVQDFNIPNIGYSLTNRLDIMPKEEYDSSVSLIVIDGNNPNRVFNTGVNKNLEVLPRYFNDRDIQSLSIEQFNEQQTLSRIRLVSMADDGFLQSGQYFFYVRYSNTDKSPTSFIAHSNAISVYKGNGIKAKGGHSELTSKSVTLNIFNVEPSYAYFEIGYIRYTQGIATAYLINNLYSTSVSDIKITGLESVTNIDTDEFLALKPYEKTCKSQAQIFNRWYGANWKSVNRHHQDLVDYAKSVTIEEYMKPIGTDKASSYIDSIESEIHNSFTNALDVSENMGYFSGETYMFLLHPVFNDGRIGLGYPVTGADNYYGDMRLPNQKGIFRFSSQHSNPVKDGINIFVKLAKFDIPTPTSGWIQANIKGWYISRARRKENLLYQGYGTDVYSGDVTENMRFYMDPSFNDRTGSFETVTKEEDLFLPLIKPSSYYVAKHGEYSNNTTHRGFAYGRINPSTAHGINQHTRASNKGGIFSTDYMIGSYIGESVPKDCFIEPIANIVLSKQGAKTTRSAVTFYDGLIVSNTPSEDTAAYHESSRVASNENGVNVDTYNVSSWSANSNNGFVSRVQEGSETRNAGGFYFLVNKVGAVRTTDDFFVSLPMATPAYLGVEKEGLNINGKIVNVYRVDPTGVTVSEWYDPRNENTFICSQFMPLSNYSGAIIASGDCFVQRTFIKALHGDDNWSDFLLKEVIGRDGDGLNLGRSEKDGYGHFLSFVAECKYNSAFRYEDSGNRFFPATGFNDIGTIAFEYGKPESPFYDVSYSQSIEQRILRGFNPQTFYGEDKFITRIMYSSVQIVQGLQDAYRQVYPAQKQDFDLQHGEITCIIEQNGSLLSFQERAIHRHTIQERVYSPSTDGSPVLLGVSNILTEFAQKLTTTNGCQHKWSVIQGMAGIYCIDSDKSAILRIQEGVESIGITKKVHHHLSLLMDAMKQSPSSNITHRLPDNTLNGVGVHSFYDPKHKEVLFTFLSNNKMETICFSEMFEYFVSRYGHTPKIYLGLNNDTFSPFEDKVYQHNMDEDNHNKFYGILEHSEIKLVIGKDTFFEKKFDQHTITASNTNFDRCEWETINQKTDLVWASAPFWNKPRYKKNQWYLSIPRTKTVQSDLNIFGVDSPVNGLYVIFKIVYSGNKRMWFKEIQTKFNKSNT